MKKLILTLFTLLLSSNIYASIGIGSGFTQVTEGRTVPILYGMVESPDWAITGFAVGVSNSYYFHNGYSLNVLKKFAPQPFLWSKLEGAVGWGFYYYMMEFDAGPTSNKLEASGYNSGPTFRVMWEIGYPIYLGVEGMFGVLNNPTSLIYLSSQEIITIILGARF